LKSKSIRKYAGQITAGYDNVFVNIGRQHQQRLSTAMEILTASFGFCIGINRAYRGMNERALKEAPFTVAHQNSKGEFDTLRRIDRREPELLNRYPGLDRISVAYDASKLDDGDRLVLGFHGFTQDAKNGLAARGVDVLDDLMCPFIAKLDRVVERLAGEGLRHSHRRYEGQSSLRYGARVCRAARPAMLRH
jgi:hypothetical protein